MHKVHKMKSLSIWVFVLFVHFAVIALFGVELYAIYGKIAGKSY